MANYDPSEVVRKAWEIVEDTLDNTFEPNLPPYLIGLDTAKFIVELTWGDGSLPFLPNDREGDNSQRLEVDRLAGEEVQNV